jgi:hypothetical protein
MTELETHSAVLRALGNLEGGQTDVMKRLDRNDDRMTAQDIVLAKLSMTMSRHEGSYATGKMFIIGIGSLVTAIAGLVAYIWPHKL